MFDETARARSLNLNRETVRVVDVIEWSEIG